MKRINYVFFGLVFGTMIPVIQVLAISDDQQDAGSDDPVSSTRNAVTNAVEHIKPFVLPAELTQKERRIYAEVRLGATSRTGAADELYALAKEYWHVTKYDAAVRICNDAIDLVPDSFPAAKCWLLCGDIEFGNRVSPPTAIKPYREAEKLLSQFCADAPSDETYQLESLVLCRLGTVFLCEDRVEEASRHFEKLLADADLVRCATPNTLLNANLDLARLNYDAGEVDAANRYYGEVTKIVESKALESGSAVSLLMEQIRRRWPDPNAPERIAALKKIWESDRYRNEPAVLSAGDELVCYYFLKTPPAPKEFSTASDEFLKRARELLKDQSHSQRIRPLLIPNLLLAAESARTKGDQQTLANLLDELEKALQRQPFLLRIPVDRSDVWAKRVMEIYYHLMPQHARKSGQAVIVGQAPACLAR